ncbi:MAG TPA: ABC transporter permease [Bryobacteraceae bacterium]|nr:ABC transporter permease [Bryobacteraceae bacterium]
MPGELFTAIRLRVQALFHRRRLDQDLDDELSFHLAMRAEKLGGADQARRAFGNDTWIRETCRELWSLGRVEIWWQDLRYGWRLLRRAPVFSAVALISLALGIGSNVAIFSLTNAVLYKPLPVRDPDQLRIVNWSSADYQFINHSGVMESSAPGRRSSGSFAYPVYKEFRDSSAGFTELAAYAPIFSAPLATSRQAFTGYGLLVSGNFIQCLGVTPAAGRPLQPADDQRAAMPAVMISHSVWVDYFERDPRAIGASISIRRSPFTIVGVLPRDYSGPMPGRPPDFIVPMTWQPLLRDFVKLESYGHWFVQIIGRLAPEADERRASAVMEARLRQIVERKEPGLTRMVRLGISLVSGRSGPAMYKNYFLRPLVILRVIAAVMLLIACVNLASLLLARGAARRHEMAIRTAIGAGRFRLVRQMLAESLLLSFMGGAAGLALARWASGPLASLIWPTRDTFRFDLGVDLRVVLFTLAVSLATALVFGLIPAIRASRTDPVHGLRDHSAHGAPRLRLGKTLVAAQVGLSVLLLAGAGLFVRTLVNLHGVDPGFDANRLLVFSLDASGANYKDQALTGFYDRVVQSVAAIPGVRAVTLTEPLLLSGASNGYGFSIPGRPVRAGEFVAAQAITVGDNFMEVLGIPMLLGRDLNASDTATSPKVFVVNEAFARTHFPNGALGQTITVAKFDYQIVGICRDTKYESLRSKAPPTIYAPFRQHAASLSAVYFEVRTAGDPLTVAPTVRRKINDLDPTIPISRFTTHISEIDRLLTQDRMFATICVFFAGLAVLLCSIGLYGVMAYTVHRRTSEMGIRIALGARPDDLTWLVWREALLLSALGAAAGVPAALAMTKLIKSRLFGVEPNDPATLAATVALLVLVAGIAAWIPSRRASRLEPIRSLRSE